MMPVPDWLSRVRIRLMQRTDLPALEWEGEFTHFRRLFADTYARYEDGGAVLWVAEFPNELLIGQLFVQLNSERPELADGATRAYVHGFRIRPAYRRGGLGTLMMAIVEDDLFRRGFRMVSLNVARVNYKAQRLYDRLGYRVVAAEPGEWSYIDQNDMLRYVSEPAWRMQKTLRGLNRPGW